MIWDHFHRICLSWNPVNLCYGVHIKSILLGLANEKSIVTLAWGLLSWTRLFQEKKAVGLRQGQRKEGMQSVLWQRLVSVIQKNGEIFPRQYWDRRGNGACESWRERMVGRGWERFASMNFGMKDRLVCVVCVSVCMFESERVSQCQREKAWVCWDKHGSLGGCCFPGTVCVYVHVLV